ncbi:MAG TPA: SDR family NAD(P)-dependent oxidoreductase [Gaiellaceae bacterium]|nr:SDR family NAD(P)-dependent oxidoreductase [Gaiellaceae bacterium]
MRRFEGRHVVVTGAGTGIGAAIAGRLREEGATVTGMARDADRVRPHVDRAIACDIRDAAQVEAAFGELEAPLYALVANAGIGGENRPGPDDRFADLVQTNVLGTYRTIRGALGLEVERIVVTSSILARIGVPHYTGYSASKAALLGLVRSFAVELAPRVQVNAIVPGWVATEMSWEGLDAIGPTREAAHEDAMRFVPMGRMTEPEEIAGTVAWLLSEEARMVTGQAIDHNGGAWLG